MFLKSLGAETENAVAINDLTIFITENNAVRIAIKADANIGSVFPDHGSCFFWMQSTYTLVDVAAIGVDRHLDDLGSELFEDQWADVVSCTVGAIDHNFQPT